VTIPRSVLELALVADELFLDAIVFSGGSTIIPTARASPPA
jgi:hypothetical protein